MDRKYRILSADRKIEIWKSSSILWTKKDKENFEGLIMGKGGIISKDNKELGVT